MSKIYLIVTVGPDYRLLPKFIEYYKRLGVDEFLVILNTSDQGPHNILSIYKISTVSSWVSEFSEHTKQQCERQIIEKHCSINDWVLYADLDEFQYYPKGLREHLDICNRYKLDFLEGRLLDRVSRDGSLISK